MSKILVTGATGHLGNLTIQHLLNEKKVPANQISALVRSEKKGQDLANKGIELRVGSYDDFDSLKEAFAGIDKLLVVSSPDLDNTNRLKQHYNVVMAAKQVDVKHVVLVSLADADSRVFGLEDVDMATEHMIQAVGLPFTFMRNGVYLDETISDLKSAIQKGTLVSATKEENFNFVLRSDLALANATVLSEDGHENQAYELVSPELFNYPKIATVLTELTGQTIDYKEAPSEDVINNLVGTGFDREVAEMLVHSFQGTIADRKFQNTSNDLTKLIGERSLKDSIGALIR